MYKVFIIIFFVILDILSKLWIFNNINLNSFLKITFFFDITHIHNFGISFGFFSELQNPWLFIAIGIIITFILIIMYIQSNKNIEKIGFTFIIAGALGNILDRSYNGYVIDFLYFHFKNFYWPAFNFADIYITLGVTLIIIQMVKDLKNRSR